MESFPKIGLLVAVLLNLRINVAEKFHCETSKDKDSLCYMKQTIVAMQSKEESQMPLVCAKYNPYIKVCVNTYATF